MTPALAVIVSSCAGAAGGCVLSCIPGLHIYNVMGLLVLAGYGLAQGGTPVPAEVLVPLFAGLVVGFAVMNTIPSVFLAAPDESAVFTVLPGQKLLMEGRGFEAVMITVAGSVAGLVGVVLVAGLGGPRLLPLVKAVFLPHAHWMLWCVIAFMVMSEWPKGGRLGPSGWVRFADAWKTLGAGLLTFVLSGLLGFIVIYRSPIPHGMAFQNLMPAFVGLFTIPWLLLNIVSRVEMPAQRLDGAVRLEPGALLKGSLAGWMGGGFAAFVPVVTGGVGGMLAGHATALRDDRAFLVSQGASKLIYYVGGFLLLFMPGVELTRGGGAWLLGSLHEPGSWREYHMALAAIALAGAVSIALAAPLTRATARIMRRAGYRRLSVGSLVVILALVAAMTGWRGLVVVAVATGIGLVPVLYGSRRMNCLGIILLPMACGMSGIGADVATWLGLMNVQ